MSDLVRSIDIGHLLAALSLAIYPLIAYSYAGGILPSLIALRTIRVRKTRLGVELTSADATAMFWSGFVTWGAPALLLLWGTKPALIGGAASPLFWFGFRLTVSVSPTRTRVVRKAAFFIPWSWSVHHDRPQAFTDGWGDFADPEAINIDLGDFKRKIELACGDKYSGTRCDDLAADFDDAVVKLCC